RSACALAVVIALLAPAPALVGQQRPPASGQTAASAQPPLFRSSVNLVMVDVVVRDRSGAVVKGLTADDFELQEDGGRQQILSFAYDEVRADAAPIENASTLGSAAAATGQKTIAIETGGGDLPSHPLTSDEVAGHRLITIVFDTNSMEPDEVQKAIDGATKWVDDRMSPADLVAVAAIGSSLQILNDFTSSKETVRAALSTLSAASGTAF